MTLRECTIFEVGLMAELAKACRESLGLQFELNWNEDSMNQALMSSGGRALGAFIQDNLVGFILYHKFSGSEEKFALAEESSEKVVSNSHLEILCLATHPVYQRMGVMRALFQELKRGAREIWLEVHESNSQALYFYKTQEFQLVGSRSRYYRDGKRAFLFTWKIKKERDSNLVDDL